MDKHLETLERIKDFLGVNPELNETLEKASDALAFAQALWNAMGEDPETEPDFHRMEHLYDAYQGELAAAALFLSDRSFDSVPALLRSVSDALPEGEEVPVVVRKGFHRLAKRIERTRHLKTAVSSAEKKS